jgi:signal transduction histidine kinase
VTNRLVLAMTALVAVVAVALAIPLATVIANNQKTTFISRLEVAALSGASLLASQPLDQWQPAVEEISAASGARVVVVGQDANLLADSSNSELDRAFDRPEIVAALQGALTTDKRYSKDLGTDLRYVAAPIVSANHVNAAIRLSLPESQVTSVVQRVQLYLALFVLAVVAFAAVVAWLIARSIVSPLRRVASVANALPDDLDLRAQEDAGPAEVRLVARSLNSTATRLQGMIQRTQRVAADASHHLRTPLTGVRLRLEAIEDISSQPDVVTQATAALDEVDRLSLRIDRVLALARTDSGSLRSELVDASTVIDQRVAEARMVADERELALHSMIKPGLMVIATPAALASLIDELLGNALTYARSEVSVEAIAMGDSLALTVDDDGPGVPSGEHDDIFKRFTRGSGAVAGGTGLGLALVQETARAYGGEAFATTSRQGGLSVRVLLPRAAA